jgi:small-conductance mechanosensitive channel
MFRPAPGDGGSAKRQTLQKEEEMSTLQITMIAMAVTMFETAAYAQWQSPPQQSQWQQAPQQPTPQQYPSLQMQQESNRAAAQALQNTQRGFNAGVRSGNSVNGR